ncbi:MAG: dockerin type I domain-containing protein [Bacillota bacterium]|nr:dockerin type I domain-containing protein [Bacillota bacterium]
MYSIKDLKKLFFILLMFCTVFFIPMQNFASSESPDQPSKISTIITCNNPFSGSLGPAMMGNFYNMSVTLTDSSGNPLANKSIAWNSESVGFQQPVTLTDENGVSVNTVYAYHEDRNRTYSATITARFEGDGDYADTSYSEIIQCYDIGPSEPNTYKISGNLSLENDIDNKSISGSNCSVRIVYPDDRWIETTTDSNGYFTINSNYNTGKVRICKPGFLAKEIQLDGLFDGTYGTGGTLNATIKIIAGDINQDDAINMMDVVELAKCFNSSLGSSNYNDACDLNQDQVINMSDVMILALNFNKTTK